MTADCHNVTGSSIIMLKGDIKMAKIMIRCPNTGKLVFTDVRGDEQSLNSIKLPKMATTCPYCGGLHYWGKSDVIFQGEDDD